MNHSAVLSRSPYGTNLWWVLGLKTGQLVKTNWSSVVMLSQICNSVGGGVFLTCHRGAGGKYRSVSRLQLSIGNRWMPRLVVLECANRSLHTMVEGPLSENVATSGLSLGKRTCRGRRAVSPPTDLAVRSRSRRDQMTLPKWGAVFWKQHPERPPSTL